MQTNSAAEPPLTLSQRIYVIVRSLNDLGVGLKVLLIVNILVLSLGWAQYKYSFDIFCFCIQRDDDFVGLVYLELSVMTAICSAFYLSGSSVSKKLQEWNEDYLEETYTIILNTTVPKGDSTGEKIFSLARAIFPELVSDYARFAAGYTDKIKIYFKKKLGRLRPLNISQALNYKVSPTYSLDLALKLPQEGYFIVKDFKEKVVTIDELNYLAKIISGRFKDKYRPWRVDVFRAICVAKHYDASFLNRESLEKLMMDDLKANFDIDLIVEEKAGYSVLWVDITQHY